MSVTDQFIPRSWRFPFPKREPTPQVLYVPNIESRLWVYEGADAIEREEEIAGQSEMHRT